MRAFRDAPASPTVWTRREGGGAGRASSGRRDAWGSCCGACAPPAPHAGCRAPLSCVSAAGSRQPPDSPQHPPGPHTRAVPHLGGLKGLLRHQGGRCQLPAPVRVITALAVGAELGRVGGTADAWAVGGGGAVVGGGQRACKGGGGRILTCITSESACRLPHEGRGDQRVKEWSGGAPDEAPSSSAAAAAPARPALDARHGSAGWGPALSAATGVPSRWRGGPRAPAGAAAPRGRRAVTAVVCMVHDRD